MNQPFIAFRKHYTVEALLPDHPLFQATPGSLAEAAHIRDFLHDCMRRLKRGYRAIQDDYYELDHCTRLTFRDNLVMEKYLARCVFGDGINYPFNGEYHDYHRNEWLRHCVSAMEILGIIDLKIAAGDSIGLNDDIAHAQDLVFHAIKRCLRMDIAIDMILESRERTRSFDARDYDTVEAGLRSEWDLFFDCQRQEDGRIYPTVRRFRDITHMAQRN